MKFEQHGRGFPTNIYINTSTLSNVIYRSIFPQYTRTQSIIMKFLGIRRNFGVNTRFQRLPAMPLSCTDVAGSRPTQYGCDVLNTIHNTVARRPGDEESVYKVAGCFSACYAGYPGAHDCHVELDAADHVRVDN